MANLSKILSIAFSSQEATAVSTSFIEGALESNKHFYSPTLGKSIAEYLRAPEKDSLHLVDLVTEIRAWLGSDFEQSSGIALTFTPTNVLHLSLVAPDVDPKSLNQIIRQELDDRLPFAEQEYHFVSSKMRNQLKETYDLELSLINKESLRRLLHLFHELDSEPIFITLPETSLAALPLLFEGQLPESFCAVRSDQNWIQLSFFENRQFKRARAIPRACLNGDGSEWGISSLRQILISLTAFERDHHVQINTVIFVNSASLPLEADQILGRECLTLPREQETESEISGDRLLPLLSARLAHASIDGLTANLRRGEFRYRPQWSHISKAMRRLTWPFFGALFAILIYLISSYALEGYYASRLEAAMQAQLKQAIATDNVTPGQELSLVQQKIGELNRQLQDIGLASQLSPLEAALRAIEKLEQAPSGIEVTRIRVTNSRLEVEGLAPSYAAIDEMTASFEAEPLHYCSVEDDLQSLRQKKLKFELRIELCDRQGGSNAN